VLHERLLAGQLVTRIFEGNAQVKVGVGYETTSMSLVTTAAGRRDPADSEFEDLTVGGAGLFLIARDLQSAGVGPETAGTLRSGLHGTRGSAQRCWVVPGLKSRECEICEEPMLRIRLRGHVRLRLPNHNLDVPTAITVPQ
jgi:hypothetical protein